jgi:hypothetical protein
MITELETLVGKIARREMPRTEADLQADVRQLLLLAPLNLTDDVLLETQVGDRRRIDVEVGSTVIEVKKDLRVGNVRAEAVTQLRGYVVKRQETYGRRYVGVLTDGAEWRCYSLLLGQLAEVAALEVDPKRVDANALLVWLEGVLATTQDVAPTPDTIRQRLGAGSSSHALDRATVAALYEAGRDLPEVTTKRRLWAKLLSTALGTQFEDSDDLFIEHTLLVNSAELIAHAVLGLDLVNAVPRVLLAGESFDAAQVFGVVEKDFFDWVVDVPHGDEFVRALARRIGRFDWSAVEHDVLKVLYESVISTETRKKLGEYYTPDWLAEQVVEALVTDPIAQRVLDPACGSGTFLFHAVRRYLAAARQRKLKVPEMLAGVTEHVAGMDLHPVAVTFARVTYLLAIGREWLLDERRGAIRVPVFLGDSMQWRRPQDDLLTDDALIIPADDRPELAPSVFRFPGELLADAQRFEEVVKQLSELASDRPRGAKVPPVSGVLRRLQLSAEDEGTLTMTFQTLCRLHDEGRDHVWGYYIRNLARPEWLTRPENRVDVLLGNPPWLAFRFMPPEMQQEFRQLSEARNLWHGAKFATQQDLSTLFVARSIQLYLKKEGRFGFVLPSAVLDRGQYKGFRAGDLDQAQSPLKLAFETPWDLRRLRPHFFPVAACVVFGERAASAQPIPQPEVWTGKLPWTNAAWVDVEPLVTRTAPKAKVKESPRSPYHEFFYQGASIVPRVLFMVERKQAGPLGQAKGNVAVRSTRSTTEKKPWKDLPALEGVVEFYFVRQIHLGETVLPYRLLPPKLAVIPRDKSGLMDGQTPRLDEYAGLSKWWRHAESVWEANRSSERLTLMQQLDYHRKLSVQFPIQPLRLVYTKSGMHLAAAWIDDQRAIVDHKLYWATMATMDQARYLCAILNARTTTQRVRPLMSYGKDERDIDKFIWNLPIPRYDKANAQHLRLAELGGRVAEEVAAMELPEDLHFAAQRRLVREFLEKSEPAQEIERMVGKLLEG